MGDWSFMVEKPVNIADGKLRSDLLLRMLLLLQLMLELTGIGRRRIGASVV